MITKVVALKINCLDTEKKVVVLEDLNANQYITVKDLENLLLVDVIRGFFLTSLKFKACWKMSPFRCMIQVTINIVASNFANIRYYLIIQENKCTYT